MSAFRDAWIAVAGAIGWAVVVAAQPTAAAENGRADDPTALVVDQVVTWTVDGGGGESSGGSFALTATVGQPDAGTVSRCGLVLDGGIWTGAVDLQVVFCGDFEGGHAGAWSVVVGAAKEARP
jgi:hypothetical protein